MNTLMFFSTLLFTLAIVAIAMLYLRHATKRVINELCHSEAASDFWLRSADILAYSGSLMLVLIFSDTSCDQNWVDALRSTLILTLAGLFLTVMFVAHSVWRTVAPNSRRAS